MADGEFDVVLAIIPEGQDEAAAKTSSLTEAVKAGGEASKGAAAAADQLSAAELRRAQATAEMVRAMQAQMQAAAEVQRQQIALAQQVQQATGASAVEMARANQVAANIQGLADRTAAMRAQLEVARQGPEAERAWAAAEALRLQIAATGAVPGSPGAAAAEAELVAQERLAQELAAITAARERDAAAAQAEANAQRQLASTLSSLQGATAQTAERTAAERQGAAAVTAYNLQLAQRNALLQAGVAEVGAQGQLVILNEEGAAAIRQQVAALEAEKAALAQVLAAQTESSAAWRLLSGVMDSVLQAGKWLILYGGLIKIWQALKDAVEETVKLEESLTRLRTLVGLNAQEVEGFRSVIHALALETGQSADENAKALFAVTSSGLRGAQAEEALRASALGAAIGLGDQTTVARAATAAMIAYGAGNLSAKAATDVMIATAREGNVSVDQLAGSFGRVIPVAATVGVSFAQVGAAVASMTRLGLSADEAVTALRGTLTALTLKEAHGADAALKSVGFSLAGLKSEIHDKGLAQALVDLVQKFGGNEEALAKIIPNVRALTEVLGNAKSQAGEYVAIQERVNAAIGHATDDAFKLVQADPAFVFRQTKTAVAELAMSLVEGLLPQLVTVAQRIKEAATAGDFRGWSEALSIAFRVVVTAGEGVAVLLRNFPTLLEAYIVWTVAAGTATTTFGNLLAFVQLRMEALAGVILANPLGAIAVALTLVLAGVGHVVDAQRAADQAFLDGVAKENQTAISLGRLANSYMTVAQAAARARTEAERQAVAAAVGAGSPIVLKAGDGSFEGQLAAIAQRYRDQVVAAHGAQEAIQAAEAARKADTSALQAHQQALIDDEAAALANRGEALRGVEAQYVAANERLLQARDAAAKIPNLDPLHPTDFQRQNFGPYIAAVQSAQEETQHLGNVVKVWSNQVTLGTAALDAQKKQLEASRAPQAEHANGLAVLSKAAENARFEIEKGIAARELEARSAAVLASAELQGAEAVRQASIVAAADKLIQADRERAKKAGIEVTALEEQRIRASTAALSDQNQVARLNQQIFASGEANHAAAVTNEGKLADALHQTSLSSQLAAAQLQVETAELKNGIPVSDDRVQRLVAEAQARVIATAETDNTVAAIKREIAADLERRQLAAELADVQGRTKANSIALTQQLAVETAVRNLGAVATQKQRDAEAARVIGLQLESDETKKQIAADTQAAEALKAYKSALATTTDDATRVGLVAQYGQAVGGLVVALGGASAATRQLALDEAVETEVLRSKVPLTEADVLAIRKRIAAQQDAVNQLHDGLALVQANADVWAPLQDGLAQMAQVGFNAFNQLVETGHISAKEIGKSLLDILLKTFEEILSNWIKLQIAMAAAEKERQAASIATSTGTSGTGPLASAGQYGSLLNSGSTSSFLGAYGGALAVVGAFVAAYLIGTGALDSKARNAFGYPGTYGLSGGKEIEIGETSIINSIQAFVKQFEQLANTTITDLDTIGVKVQASGHRFRAYVGDTFVGEFDYMAQAIGTAFSIAIKSAKFAGPISSAITDLLATRDFTSTDELAAALKTVSDALSQNLPKLTTDFRALNQVLDDQVKAQHGLYLLYSSSGFQTLFTQDVQHYRDGLQAIRDGITGQQQSAYVAFEQQREAFNAEIAARRLSITVQIEETKTKLAALGVTLQALEAIRAASAGGANYNGGGGPTGPNGGFLGPNGGAGPTITQGGPGPTAVKDQTIADLKALLDLLMRELGALPQEISAAEFRNPRAANFYALQFDDATAAIQKLTLTLADGTKGADEFNASLSGMLGDLAQSLSDQRDAITGRQRSAAEDLALRQQQAAAWNAEKALREAELAVQIETIKGKIAEAEAARAAAVVSIASAEAQGQAAAGLAAILASSTGISDAALAALQQQLAALQGVLATIQNIAPIDPNEIVRTGGGGDTARQRQDALAQMNAELEKLGRTNLPTAVNAVIDLGLQLADLAKRTHDAHASEVLLAQARQALIDQAKAQILDPVRGSLLPGQGGTYGVSAQEKGRLDTLKLFADAEAAQRKLLETTGQRAIAFWQLQDAKVRALNALAEQDIAGLGLPMEQTRKKVSDLRDSLGFLWTSLADGAISVQRMVDVLGQLQDQAGTELLGLAQGLLTTIGDTEEAAKVKHALDVASFELQRLQINYLYQQYKALGLVSAAVQGILDEALQKINAFDSSKIGAAAAAATTPTDSGQLSSADYAAAVAADKARYQGTLGGGTGLTADQALQGLAQYELAQQSQLAQQIAKVNADFASYRAVLGDTVQVQRDYALALRSVITGALQPLQSFLDGLNTSQFSPLKAADQLAAAQQTFEQAIGAVQEGNLAHLGDLTSYAQAYLQQALSSLPVGSDEYKRIEARVEAEVRAILAQYGGTPPPPAGGPGAPPPPGGTPPPPPPVNVQPVVDAVRDVAADQLVELKEITRNTRETQQEVYALRRRLDDPVTVFERVS